MISNPLFYTVVNLWPWILHCDRCSLMHTQSECSMHNSHLIKSTFHSMFCRLTDTTFLCLNSKMHPVSFTSRTLHPDQLAGGDIDGGKYLPRAHPRPKSALETGTQIAHLFTLHSRYWQATVKQIRTQFTDGQNFGAFRRMFHFSFSAALSPQTIFFLLEHTTSSRHRRPHLTPIQHPIASEFSTLVLCTELHSEHFQEKLPFRMQNPSVGLQSERDQRRR